VSASQHANEDIGALIGHSDVHREAGSAEQGHPDVTTEQAFDVAIEHRLSLPADLVSHDHVVDRVRPVPTTYRMGPLEVAKRPTVVGVMPAGVGAWRVALAP